LRNFLGRGEKKDFLRRKGVPLKKKKRGKEKKKRQPCHGGERGHGKPPFLPNIVLKGRGGGGKPLQHKGGGDEVELDVSEARGKKKERGPVTDGSNKRLGKGPANTPPDLARGARVSYRERKEEQARNDGRGEVGAASRGPMNQPHPIARGR